MTRAARVIPVRWSMPAWHSAAGTWTERRAVLVVTELDGVFGLGEAAPLPGMSDDDDDACAAALAGAGDVRWASDVATIAAQADEAAPHAPAAAWAMFSAVLDAKARARGCSVAALLRPSLDGRVEQGPHAVPVATVVDSPEAARAAVARGIRTLKVKIGAPADIAAAAAAVAAIRAAVGPAIAIRADANRGFALDQVPALVAALARYDLEYLEEPAPGLGPLLRTASVPPIALDESLGAPHADRWLPAVLATGAVGVVVLKPSVLGPARTLALIARARAAGVAVVITHALEGPVGTAAAIELALALADTGRAAGLAAHPALAAWPIAIPTLSPATLVDVPRVGTGLDHTAALQGPRP